MAVNAQIDAHYWTHQYGAKGLLLNGAVIASTEDETAIFYNPGAMGRGEKFGLSLSFLTPSYSRLTTKNFLGDGTTVIDRDIGFSPGFAAVGFPLFDDDRFRGGATTFTRFKSNINFRGRELGVIPNNPEQLFIGNLDFKRKLTERWIGFGLSYKVNETLSVGGSQFLVIHGESTDIRIQKEIVAKNQPTHLITAWRSNLRYAFNASGGFLTKLGLSWKPDNNDIIIGLTLTSPTYAYVHKSASYEFDDLKKINADSTILNANLDNNATLNTYKTPFSIGYGIDFSYNRWRFSLSAEYFRNIKTYTIIEADDDPFNGFADGDFSLSTSVRSGNKEVFNFAIGVQRKLYDGSTFIIGFRTDFNQRRPVEGFSEFEFLASTPSIYHLSAGGLFELWGNEVSIGFDYGFGTREGNQNLIEFSEVNAENLFDITPGKNVRSVYESFVIIITYDFIFKRRRK